MEYTYLKIEEHENIAVMKVSAPKTLNALNTGVFKDMDDYLSKFDCE